MMAVDVKEFYDQSTSAYLGFNRWHLSSENYAFFLEHLADRLLPGAKVLQLHIGTGYMTTCIARMVGPEGRVIGIDNEQLLINVALKNIRKRNSSVLDDNRLSLLLDDCTAGYQKEAPYDVIFVNEIEYGAVPDILIQQLAIGGRLIASVLLENGNLVYRRVDKTKPSGEIETRDLHTWPDYRIPKPV